ARLVGFFETVPHGQADRGGGLRQSVLFLRVRVQARLSGSTPVRSWPAIFNGEGLLRFIRKPKIIAWLGLMMPSVAWLVLGGYPQTAWLQAALAKPTP